MLVKDLIGELSKIPGDAKVFIPTGEFKDDEAAIRMVKYRPNSGYGIPANSVLIDWKS